MRSPVHVHGARTDREYERMQRKYMQALHRSRPEVFVRATLWEAAEGAEVRVTGGKWVVDCACGNCPSASVAWDLARCFECGAVYRALAWPAERAAIEAVLDERPRRAQHWRPSVSVAALIEEQP